MKQQVVCKNCGLEWLLVNTRSIRGEMNTDWQSYCPKCGSNWYEVLLNDDFRQEICSKNEDAGGDL